MLIPNSYGSSLPLREYNTCHGADDGKFCSTPGTSRSRMKLGGKRAGRPDNPLAAEPRREHDPTQIAKFHPRAARAKQKPGEHAPHDDLPNARRQAQEVERAASPELKRIIDRIRNEAQSELEREFAPLLARGEQVFEESFSNDTTKQHMKDGVWTPERNVLHEEILTRVATEKFGHVQTGLANPTVVFLGGMPGAGKSTASKGLNTKNAFVIDPDEFKKELPEFNGSNAAAVAAESGYLADRLMKIAHDLRANVLIDGTMKTAGVPGANLDDGLLGKLAAFKSSGYRTEVRFVDVTPEQSIQRVTKRFLDDLERGNKDARYVPLGFVRKALADPKYGTKPRRSYELVKDAQLEKGGWLVDSHVSVNGWTRERQGGRGTLKDAL